MDQKKFMEYEYLTLREEIKETKTRLFRLAAISLVAMPSFYSVAKIYELKAIILSLPLLICAVILLFLSESRALMRCGTYIKNNIEYRIRNEYKDNDIGWEHWLQERPSEHKADRRDFNKFSAVFFYIVFFFYYVTSVHQAALTCHKEFGVIGLAVCLGAYVGIGLIFIAIMIIYFKKCCRTDN